MGQSAVINDPRALRLPFPCGCVAFSGPGDAFAIEWCPQHARTHEVLDEAPKRAQAGDRRV